jgi:hypothetical protein
MTPNEALQRTPATRRGLSFVAAWWSVAGSAELGRSACPGGGTLGSRYYSDPGDG